MKKFKNIFKQLIKRTKKNKREIFVFTIILAVFIFLRFYQFEERNPFAWDQVDNAWAAKNILVEHKFPLTGMQAKLNSGVFIGPLYYYYISFFYFLTNLDPIASGIAAGATGIITLITIYFVFRNLFSQNTAFIAMIFYTFSFAATIGDRTQWPVNFVFPLSLLIFYSLYKIITGSAKHILLLAILLGLSFNVHFTSTFYPIIILGCLPFFPRTRETLKYILYSIPAFLIIISPIIYYLIKNIGVGGRGLFYLGTYYHGLHLTRVLQLTSDAFIQFESMFFFPQLKYLGWISLPLFGFVYVKDKVASPVKLSKTIFNGVKERMLFVYLCALWILVPWFLFSLYSGEIADYYFLITRPIVLIIMAYLFYFVFKRSLTPLKILLILLLIFYSYANLVKFFGEDPMNLKKARKEALNKMQNEKIEFVEGVPESYLYYIYKERYEPPESPWKWK